MFAVVVECSRMRSIVEPLPFAVHAMLWVLLGQASVPSRNARNMQVSGFPPLFQSLIVAVSLFSIINLG